MRILIIGDPGSVFINQLIAQLKEIDAGLEVDVLFFSKGFSFCPSPADSLIDLSRRSSGRRWLDILYRLAFFFLRRLRIRRIGPYDVVNIQSYSAGLDRFWPDISRLAACRIISFWGSDFYKASDAVRQSYVRALEGAELVTFTNPGMLEDVAAYYGRFREKMTVCSFGLETLSHMKETGDDALAEFRNRFSIPPDRKIVICGYAARPAQRHREIIRALLSLDHESADNCCFLFPMAYGDTSYRDEIADELVVSGLNHAVLTELLSPADMARLWLCGDVMINIQESDQFSGSMQEALFAGCRVIAGAWLPYGVLVDRGVSLELIASPGELAVRLAGVIAEPPQDADCVERNRRAIWELSSWEVNARKWYQLYQDCLSARVATDAQIGPRE